jgi:hypothetical protein
MPNKQEKRIGICCTQGRISCWSFFIFYFYWWRVSNLSTVRVEQYFVFVTPLLVDSFAKFWVCVSPVVFFAKLYGMPFYSLFQLFNVCQCACHYYSFHSINWWLTLLCYYKLQYSRMFLIFRSKSGHVVLGGRISVRSRKMVDWRKTFATSSKQKQRERYLYTVHKTNKKKQKSLLHLGELYNVIRFVSHS